jgi:hypothetical protein
VLYLIAKLVLEAFNHLILAVFRCFYLVPRSKKQISSWAPVTLSTFWKLRMEMTES